MPLELRPGLVVSVPCRHCGRALAVTLRDGVQKVRCGKCGGTTRVSLTLETGQWRLRTAREPV